MRIIFMGTPEFAAESLKQLYSSGHDIAGVFTQADKPRNRGMKMSFSPVKELALAHGIPIYQPVTLKDGIAAGIIKDLQCELICVVAYGKLLPAEILKIPPLGCINIHGSILPKYRGASPVQHAILNGEKETGVTSMYLVEEMDAGDILFVKKTVINDDETSSALLTRLGVIGAQLLCETVDAMSRGEIKRLPQNHNEASYAPLLTKDMSPIDWTQSAYMIKCKVRGLQPWPAATMNLDGNIVKVFSVDITGQSHGKRPGSIVSAGLQGIEVACSDGSVTVKELQAPGGKRMSAADFLRGNRIRMDFV